MPVYKLLLEYDGGGFSGWQAQPGRRTVQGELEAALRRLFGRRVATVGASRTDAGVHARGQAASFRAPRSFPGDLAAALNRNLPEDVAVLSARRAPDAFHARRHAVEKTYVYRIFNRPVKPALDRRRALWLAAPLDVGAMRAEARRLAARRNFAEFGGPSSRTRSPLCRFRRLSVARAGDEVAITLTADRFLHNMARRLAGRLLQAGLGKEAAGRPLTLAARGLELVRVRYKNP